MKFAVVLLGTVVAVNPLSPGSENLPSKFGHEVQKGYPVLNVQYEFPAVSKDSVRRLHSAQAASAALAQELTFETQRGQQIASMLASNPTFLAAFPGAADTSSVASAGGSLASIVDRASELNRSGEEAAADVSVGEEVASKQQDVSSKLKNAASTFGSIGSFLSRAANDASELLIGLSEVAGPPTQSFGKSYIDPTRGHSWAACNMNFAGCPSNFAMGDAGLCVPSSLYEGPCDQQNFSEFTVSMMEMWASRCKTQWACA